MANESKGQLRQSNIVFFCLVFFGDFVYQLCIGVGKKRNGQSRRTELSHVASSSILPLHSQP